MIEKLRTSFIEDLIVNGDTWKVLRKSTLVDLVRINYFNYLKNGDPYFLIAVFNDCIKIQLLSVTPKIDITENINELSTRFNLNNLSLINEYDIILNSLEKKSAKLKTSKSHTLNDHIEYLKVINGLELDDYSDEIFLDIANSTFEVLSTGDE